MSDFTIIIILGASSVAGAILSFWQAEKIKKLEIESVLNAK